MNAHVSFITLGVQDLDRAKRFYGEGLGWPIHSDPNGYLWKVVAGSGDQPFSE